MSDVEGSPSDTSTTANKRMKELPDIETPSTPHWTSARLAQSYSRAASDSGSDMDISDDESDQEDLARSPVTPPVGSAASATFDHTEEDEMYEVERLVGLGGYQ